MRSHSRSCSGSKITLTAGSITAASPPKASEPVPGHQLEVAMRAFEAAYRRA
jgi:hypothetical protein